MIDRWEIQDKSGEFRFNIDLIIKADSFQKFQDLLYEVKNRHGINLLEGHTEFINGSIRFDKPDEETEYYNYDYINGIWDLNNSHHIVRTKRK